MKWNRTHTAVLFLIIGLSFLLSIGMYYLFLKDSLDNFEEVSNEREKQKNMIANQTQFDIEEDITMFHKLPVDQNHKDILTRIEAEREALNIQINQLTKTDATVDEELPEGIEVSTFTLSISGESEQELLDFMESIEANERIFSINEAVVTRIGEQAWQASLLLNSYHYPNSQKLKVYMENSPS
ncbi:hypothetical protein GGQ92_000721 [Gracilibacillus halotolerans]|uniref:Type IV pilus assembly protein PilO n=1 Tax=Gracilibacillus halotolerans TaxID=74386 RepID=A0A841RLZ2_9BACI|nr:hypothetical protein [Gracilibacillus halotolerans]MBB6511954.1 hypothetical protein [Gracilibacillus halotolerans]